MEYWNIGKMGLKVKKSFYQNGKIPLNPILQHSLRGIGLASRRPIWVKPLSSICKKVYETR
jgi:hypothetical protein